MVPASNSLAVSRALQKYDYDDTRYLVPYAQEGKLGCIVALRRSTDNFVDEILHNRKTLVLDAASTGSVTDDDSSVDDASLDYPDADDISVDNRQRRYAFRRAARRIFNKVAAALANYFRSWCTSTKRETCPAIDTPSGKQELKKYETTGAKRADQSSNIIGKLWQVLREPLFLSKEVPSVIDVSVTREAKISKHYPKHRHSSSLVFD